MSHILILFLHTHINILHWKNTLFGATLNYIKNTRSGYPFVGSERTSIWPLNPNPPLPLHRHEFKQSELNSVQILNKSPDCCRKMKLRMTSNSRPNEAQSRAKSGLENTECRFCWLRNNSVGVLKKTHMIFFCVFVCFVCLFI